MLLAGNAYGLDRPRIEASRVQRHAKGFDQRIEPPLRILFTRAVVGADQIVIALAPGDDLTSLGFASTPTVITETGYYQVEVTSADANNFSATATYQRGGNEAGKCLTFTIDGRGNRTSAPAPDCWTNTRL